MKSFHSIATICIFSFLFTACKKDAGSSSPSQQRLIRYTETLNPGTAVSSSTIYNLAYDENNRLMSLTNSQDPGSRYVFNYAQGGYNFDIYGSGTLVIHQNVFMNGAVIDSTIQYNKEGDTISEKYIYWGGNELKYLTTYKVTSSGSQVINGTEYIYGFNDELILEQDYFSTTSYTYNTIVANNFDLYPVYVNRSKQLPSKITYSNSTGEKTWNHTYTFDAQHRLIADSIFASTGGVTLKKFTYE